MTYPYDINSDADIASISRLPRKIDFIPPHFSQVQIECSSDWYGASKDDADSFNLRPVFSYIIDNFSGRWSYQVLSGMPSATSSISSYLSLPGTVQVIFGFEDQIEATLFALIAHQLKQKSS